MFEQLLIEEISKRCGTPFYCYFIEKMIRNFSSIKMHLDEYEIFYSIKANPAQEIILALRDRGSSFEAASVGEIKLALEAGINPEKILLVGPGKLDSDLKYAIQNNVFAIVVESIRELIRLNKISGEEMKKTNVLLRVNPKKRFTFSQEVMVGGASKFGIDEENFVHLRNLVLENVNLLGLHVYSASQVLNAESLLSYSEYVLSLALKASTMLDFSLKVVDLGGGFGIPYSKKETPFDLVDYGKNIKKIISNFEKRAEGKVRVIFEVGRYIVGNAGLFVTKIIDVKESRGKKFLITDGGINAFTRTAFLGVNHPVKILGKYEDHLVEEVDIVGPCCTPFDIIGKGVLLPRVNIGDTVVVFNAGAYGKTMSMTGFHSRGDPVEVVCCDGKWWRSLKTKNDKLYRGSEC